MKKELAFPRMSHTNCHDLMLVEEDGMTLRDYFAAKALQGLIASGDDPFLISDMAKSAYAMADAMLKARG